MKDLNTAAPSTDRAFLNIITAHRNGVLITDVSKALKQVTSAVQLTGKPGKVTLTMNLRPATVGDSPTLIFEASLKTTIPETDRPGTIFYADDDFNLVRDDPRQQKLALKVVETPSETSPLKTLNAE